jgi:hypothetical protein
MALAITKYLNSAFSRGVGYERQPPGTFFEADRVRGYFIDFRAKTTSSSAAQPDELAPAGLAQLGLGFWELSLAGDANATTKFLQVCDSIERRAEPYGDELRWPYYMSVAKYRLKPPHYSALAQAQIASAFVRAHLLRGDPHHAEVALAAIRPLLDRGSDLVAATVDGPVPEEAPSQPPSHILNGWIYALWGLWDVHLGLREPLAGDMLTASIDCLRLKLPAYDVGWWSKYSLYPYVLGDLAKPFYHRLHIDQLEVMYRLTGFSDFAEIARRWRDYDTPSRRVVSILHKALFVGTGYA